MPKTVLFDLDGTLLPMDQDVFTKEYFSRLAKKAAPLGYEPNALIDAVWRGTAAMVKNDGSRTNMEAFWDTFAAIFGEESRKDIPVFDSFYRTEFNKVKAFCGFAPAAGETVRRLKENGCEVVLASNPLFPLCGQQNRMRWAGLNIADFSYITSYENSRYCKPNPKYYEEILQKIGRSPADCLMVGNDAREDTPALTLGIEVFLLTDNLLHPESCNVDTLPHGGFGELNAFLKERKFFA